MMLPEIEITDILNTIKREVERDSERINSNASARDSLTSGQGLGSPRMLYNGRKGSSGGRR